LQAKVLFRKASFPRSSPSKIRFFTSPVVQLSKIFNAFFPMKTAFLHLSKFIFDFSFDSFNGRA
jgi:hypothetical protein